MADTPHPQVQTLLEDIAARGMPPTQGLAVETARELNAALFTPTEVEAVDDVIDLRIPGPSDGAEIPVRLYRPDGDRPHPVLVYLHGGGWTVGSIDSYDGVCRALANRAECAVLSVGYRLAPEHPFPAAPRDCYAAVEWVAEHAERLRVDPQRIAVGGDSAGGNLSAAMTLMTRDRDGPELAHQVLIYPAVNSPRLRSFPSYDENGEGYLLETAGIEWYYDKYLTHETDHRNEYAFPLLASELRGMPSATVVTAGFDPLRDEGAAYAEALADAGVAVDHHAYDDVIHGFVSFYERLDRANDALDAIGADLRDAFAE